MYRPYSTFSFSAKMYFIAIVCRFLLIQSRAVLSSIAMVLLALVVRDNSWWLCLIPSLLKHTGCLYKQPQLELGHFDIRFRLCISSRTNNCVPSSGGKWQLPKTGAVNFDELSVSCVPDFPVYGDSFLFVHYLSYNETMQSPHFSLSFSLVVLAFTDILAPISQPGSCQLLCF